MVDEVRVSPIENFSTRKRYGMIIDVYGPLNKVDSLLRRQRIFNRYFYLLKPGGSLFVSCSYPPEILFFDIEKHFGKNSEFARKRGFYFSGHKAFGLDSYSVIEIKKLPLH
jgi:hypothetical protein